MVTTLTSGKVPAPQSNETHPGTGDTGFHTPAAQGPEKDHQSYPDTCNLRHRETYVVGCTVHQQNETLGASGQ